MKTIALLLTVYNRKDKTLSCLEQVFHQAGMDTEFRADIFLVDDGSTDGTAEAIKAQFPAVNIIVGHGNLYWNRGMHLAWSSAVSVREYDYFLWLNDDTVIYEDAIKTLLETSEVFDNNRIVAGTTRALESEKVTYGGRQKGGKLIVPTSEPQSCYTFNGNIVLIPNAVYQKVGMNDPKFHHALGDFDYGLRARKLNVDLVVAPDLLGKCDSHESLPTWCDPAKPFKKRWLAFRTPLGQNPEQFFLFERRHSGLLKAVLHYTTNHLKVIMPSLWN